LCDTKAPLTLALKQVTIKPVRPNYIHYVWFTECGLQSVVSKATLEMFIALFQGLPNSPVCIMQECKQSKTGWCKDLGMSLGCSYSCRNVLV